MSEQDDKSDEAPLTAWEKLTACAFAGCLLALLPVVLAWVFAFGAVTFRHQFGAAICYFEPKGDVCWRFRRDSGAE